MAEIDEGRSEGRIEGRSEEEVKSDVLALARSDKAITTSTLVSLLNDLLGKGMPRTYDSP